MWSIALAPQTPRQKQRGLAGRIVENRLWGSWAAPGSQGGMCEPRVTGARLGHFDRQASYRFRGIILRLPVCLLAPEALLWAQASIRARDMEGAPRA
jgi:hypothetical protein